MKNRNINFKQIIQNVFDQYPQGFHGLQKDAIQNSWDARKNKKGNGWKVEFDMVSAGKKNFFIIQDFGTEGLTGNKFGMDYENSEEIEEIPEKERWAKFECYGATKKDTEKLGSRGQGKFLFIYASKNGKIFYDSLRNDGTYRFGFTQDHGAFLDHWIGDDAKKKNREMTGLGEIEENHGTRIIIEDPKEEFIKYYEEDFLDAIEETWWPLIKKFNIEIILKRNGTELSRAKVPPIFSNFSSQKIKKDLEYIQFEYGKNRSLKGKIKHLHIACADDELEERFVGIAVFRNGMKILNVKFDGSYEYNKRIFGYIEFENETDILLRDIENPNHYGFKNESLWKSAEEKIKSELRQFAEEKLGIGKREHEKKKDNQKDRQVSALMNDVLKKLHIPIDLNSDGPTKPSSSGSGSTKNPQQKDICIYDDNVLYTENDIKRISYGSVLQCSCKIRGDVSEKLRIKIGIYSKVNEILELKNKLHDGGDVRASKKIGDKIENGKYTIKFQLIRETDEEILDEKSHVLWVQDYPPGKSPFKIERVVFPDKKNIEWDLNYERKILNFNIDHSYYKYANTQKGDFLVKHEAEMGVVATVSFIIREVEMGHISKEKIEDNELFNNLFSEDNTTKTTASLQVYGQIRDILYGGEN